MRYGVVLKMRALVVAVSVVTATTALVAVSGLGPAAPAYAATGGTPCPALGAVGNFLPATNVGALSTATGSTTREYTFVSLTNENPNDGVRGLIGYCVYPNTQPTGVTVDAHGANGDPWIASLDTNSFAFVRPHGNKSNIPLDGNATTMGTVMLSGWTSEQILLHINDATECRRLYGNGPDTCFVKPSAGPICDKGQTDVAYNAMPFGVVDCPKVTYGFEARSANELGNEVTLTGTARQLVSLEVLFASYACSVSGHWNTGDCVTTPGATFTHPVTANIYAAGVDNNDGTRTPGALLAHVTQTFTFQYRPSADPVKCAASLGFDPSQWFNPVAGRCQYSISKVLTFNFSLGITLPDQVIWTVAYNTTHSGYTPIPGAPCTITPPGCPYDSLNVGLMTFDGSPYAGTNVNADSLFVYTSTQGDYCDSGAVDILRLAKGCWEGQTPLGRIITTGP